MMYFARNTRHTVSPKRGTAKPRLELLEERQLLSGFGPADGAYIEQDRAGGDYRDVQIQADTQAIVAAGDPGDLPYGDFGVERYLSDGTLDTSYGNSGLASPVLGPWQNAQSLVLQQDGKAVVAGQVLGGGSYDLGLARLNPDGSPDASFGNGGWAGFSVQPGTDEARAVGLQSTGKIVVAGQSNRLTTSPWYSSTLVARFTAGGAIDSGKGAFGQVVQGQAAGYTLTSFGGYTDVAVQPDDKLVAVGSFGDGNTSSLVVARYTATGTLDKTFNGKGYAVLAPAGISNLYFEAVALQSNGKIVVVGGAAGIDGADDMLVASFNADGTLDTSFAGGAGYTRLDVNGTASITFERASDVAIQTDGKIVVCGSTWVPGNPGSVLVARLNSDGTLDSTFGSGGFKLGSPLAGTGYHDFEGKAVALQSDGSIIVAGVDYWGTTGDTGHPLLMRFFPTSSNSLTAAGGASALSSGNAPLSSVKVRPLLTAGIGQFPATGANVTVLGSLDARVTNLPAATLDLSSGDTISLDSNAADWGWFVVRSSRRGQATQAGRLDFLSTLTTR